jgi:hypothetical protein
MRRRAQRRTETEAAGGDHRNGSRRRSDRNGANRGRARSAETTTIAATPLSGCSRRDLRRVGAAAAPLIPLDSDQQAALAELDQQIEDPERDREAEHARALISTSDEERTTPLVDDPSFREISQRLPKLQADLQTLRERRNKIQPTAPTP